MSATQIKRLIGKFNDTHHESDYADFMITNKDLPKKEQEEWERGIKNDIALMRKGFIDEVRLYGERISTGMSHEVDLAIELGIEVVPMTEATKREFAERWQNVL